MATQSAFLFVKPHAADSEAAVSLVESMLTAAGITMTNSGVLEASVIDEKKLIGKIQFFRILPGRHAFACLLSP